MIHHAKIYLSATLVQCALWTRNNEQAYMQFKPLNRDVYTIPPWKASLSKSKPLKTTFPYYGLVECSSCFFEAYYPVLTDILLMRSAAFDRCFLFHMCDKTLNSILGLATDDSLNTGNAHFQQDKQETTKNFVAQTTRLFPCAFWL